MENYTTFKIPKKSGGFREISAPSPELKQKQRDILQKLYEQKIIEHISYYAYGFVPGQSIYNNARVHAGKKFILNVDIKNFFPSCTKENALYIASLKKLLSKDEFNLLFHKNSLPQGAPTSPLISNLFLADFDVVLPAILRRTISDDIRYSRYADDITISSNSKAIFSKSCIRIISNTLEHYGFKINSKKTRFMSPSSKQEITGLVVNSGKATVSRKIRRKLRAAVHNITTGKVAPTKKELNRIKGHLAFCMQVPEHRQWAANLLSKLGVNANANYTKKESKIEDTFKKTIEAYAKKEITELPYNINTLNLAKMIFRSKNLPHEVRLQYLQKLCDESYDWLLNTLKRDIKVAERFVMLVAENPKLLSQPLLKEILKAIAPKLSKAKRMSLIVTCPNLKDYIGGINS